MCSEAAANNIINKMGDNKEDNDNKNVRFSI